MSRACVRAIRCGGVCAARGDTLAALAATAAAAKIPTPATVDISGHALFCSPFNDVPTVSVQAITNDRPVPILMCCADNLAVLR